MESTETFSNTKKTTEEEAEILERVRQRALINPFPKYNHIQLAELKRDYAEMYVDIVPESRNAAGNVHGGLYFTLADFCAATTARTDGRKYVTQSAEVHYLKTIAEGRITAKSRLVHRGRTSVLVEVDIFDDKDRLLFRSSMSMFCIG